MNPLDVIMLLAFISDACDNNSVIIHAEGEEVCNFMIFEGDQISVRPVRDGKGKLAYTAMKTEGYKFINTKTFNNLCNIIQAVDDVDKVIKSKYN